MTPSPRKQANHFFRGVVEWLNRNNISFHTYQEPSLQIKKIRLTRENTLQVWFQNGMNLLLSGVIALKNIVMAPFDLLINLLNGLAGNRVLNRQSGPVVINLFSFLSLFSILGLFSLIHLL